MQCHLYLGGTLSRARPAPLPPLKLQLSPLTHKTTVFCTGDKRPISLIADKGTITRDSLQMTLIQMPSLKNGFLFETFFIGNPLALKSDGSILQIF